MSSFQNFRFWSISLWTFFTKYVQKSNTFSGQQQSFTTATEDAKYAKSYFSLQQVGQECCH